MNKIDEIAYTPSTIVREFKTFRIPLYQRPYSWEELQVRQLLKDLYSAYETYEKYLVADYQNPTFNYYIGILSVAKTVDDKARYDLIDGQQRITTLMLIGKAAKEYYDGWQHFLTPDRLDLYGREKDQDFLNHDNKAECNWRMVNTLQIAENFLGKEIKERQRSVDFSKYIYGHAAFFLSKVPHSYSLMDKNQQFVRMNNRGKQLEKHEILKVHLISRMNEGEQNKAYKIWNDMVDCLTNMKDKINDKDKKDKNDDKNIDDERNDKLLSLENILKDKDNKDGEEPKGKEPLYSAIVTVPEFLVIALARYCKKNVSPDKDKLLETFKVLQPEDKDNAKNMICGFIEVLEKQVELLKGYFIFLNRDGESDIDYTLGYTDDDKFEFSDTLNGKARLRAVQSFLHVSTEPHHWLVPALDWCAKQDQKIKVKAEEFVKALEHIDNELLIPSENKRNLSLLATIEKMEYPNVSHYWFYRLDYELWKLWKLENQQPDVWDTLRKSKGGAEDDARGLLQKFRFRRCGSVEHIWPQHLTVRGGTNTNQPDHSFGNLALISRQQNSKFNNSEPDSKKQIIVRSKYTESLKMLHFLWGNQEPKSEGEIMYNILKKAVG